MRFWENVWLSCCGAKQTHILVQYMLKHSRTRSHEKTEKGYCSCYDRMLCGCVRLLLSQCRRRRRLHEEAIWGWCLPNDWRHSYCIPYIHTHTHTHTLYCVHADDRIAGGGHRGGSRLEYGRNDGLFWDVGWFRQIIIC